MMKSLKVGVLSLLVSCISVQADTLVQVYHQALLNDPVYAEAESSWHSAQMNLPIARSGYLPQLDLEASGTRNYKKIEPTNSAFSQNGYTWQYGYQLSLMQPLFNLSAWHAIKGASAQVKAATANYLSAEQSLMQRTAKTYFNVMQAYDQLRYTLANKKAVHRQLVTANQKFKVGLIAITDVYDARSQYDQVIAQEIAAQNMLNIQLENLRAITGQHYKQLNGLGMKLPLLKPKPSNINQWVSVANHQNYQLKAQSYAVLGAMDNVKKIAAGGYPTLNVTGGFSQAYVDGSNVNTVNASSSTTDEQANLGLSLSYKPVQGGFVVASTKQARYDYATASAKLEQVHREVVNQTRSGYLSVLSGISQIKADRQRILSARNALAATKAGFKVGTRTMVDVLNDLSTLYQAQQQYADDQYAYLSHLIDLKVAAGTLSLHDLQQISAWMNRVVVLPAQSQLVMPLRHLVPPHDGVKKKHAHVKKAHLKTASTKKKINSQAKKILALPTPSQQG